MHSIYNSLHILNPDSYSIPPPLLSSLATIGPYKTEFLLSVLLTRVSHTPSPVPSTAFLGFFVSHMPLSMWFFLPGTFSIFPSVIQVLHPLDHRKSKRVPQKHLFLLYWLHQSFDWVDHNKLWKILQEMGIPDHLTCLLRNLYARQDATVRTRYGTTDWVQIGKGVRQGCILSPCLFNFYAECIMQNAGLDEAQAGIKIAGRNINNLRYVDDTTLITESKRNWRASLWKWKGRVKRLAQNSTFIQSGLDPEGSGGEGGGRGDQDGEYM